MGKNYVITSESVAEGHPDKICDQISDGILDAILEKDPFARVACEVVATNGMVLVTGEITTSCYIEIPEIVRKVIVEIGYDKPEYGFDGRTCGVVVAINKQSPDISQGVSCSMEMRQASDSDKYNALGAGDQGMMIGYACNETPEYMPLPIVLSHRLCQRLSEVRREGIVSGLRPDGKSQVSVEYVDDKPVRVTSVVIATQHDPEVSYGKLSKDIIDRVISNVTPKGLLNNTQYFINGTGKFVVGGPVGDTGLTGRKILVDTYGGIARHGGGAFSGKDPTKVDRSAAYMARYVAKNLVAAGLADRLELQVSYVIGKAYPTSMYVNTFGTGSIADEEILKLIDKYFDFRPAAIIERLNLRRPIYRQTARFGHFGRTDIDLPWEKLDMVSRLK